MDLIVWLSAIFLGLALLCELCLILPVVACWAWDRLTGR
jgi:hypothetical protein